jgi:hypothetical protein
MIKTFRGLLEDGEQDKIRLSTKKGKIGYKIIKFVGMSPSANNNIESTLKIFKVTQTSISHDIDFSDGNLLAAMVLTQSTTSNTAPEDQTIMFEQEIFNQDIFITLKGADYSSSANYYLELEVVSLTDNAAAVSTLRDIRLNPQAHA